MFKIVLFLILCAGTIAQTISFLKIYNYNECVGKEVANYTQMGPSFGASCDLNVRVDNEGDYLIQTSAKGVVAVNAMAMLTNHGLFPIDAYHISERLALITSGPLVGQYVYQRNVILEKTYLKKCSSVLGYSYTPTKSAVLLISDRLDVNVLLSPTGAYELFKKGCTTVCKGYGYWI